jgi:hypothetical protein
MNDPAIEVDGVSGLRDFFEEGLRLSFQRSPFRNS